MILLKGGIVMCAANVAKLCNMYRVPNHPVFKSFAIVKTLSGTYICPGWIPVPDNIDRKDVQWETLIPKSPPSDFTEHFIKGATGDYKVTISNHYGNRCTCPGYTFRKTCRHIKEITES